MPKRPPSKPKAKARKPAKKPAKKAAKKAAPATSRKPAPPAPAVEAPLDTPQPRATLLSCPKCGSGMQPFLHEGIELDRCTGCRGLWFDILEHEDLKKIEGSEAIDIGDASTGREMNEVDRIQCPVCRVDMLRMSDAEQRHIWVESCPKCHGVFFDAGEFTDWKERDALDWLRSLMAGERP